MNKEKNGIKLKNTIVNNGLKKKQQKKTQLRKRASKIDKEATSWVKKNITIKKHQEDGKINELPTDGFGEVDFKGVTRKSKAKFIRFSDTASPGDIFKLMTKHWKILNPRLIIIVSGEYSSDLKITDRFKETFSCGLLKVAQTRGAWFLTSGLQEGITKLIGETLKGSTKECIGITPYHKVTNKDDLKSSADKKNLGGSFSYRISTNLFKEGKYLDHNHTHHLLVDGEESGAVSFRAKFIKYVVDNCQLDVPNVFILYQGSIETLSEILVLLANQTALSVIIIKNSGKLSYLLIYTLDVIKHNDKELCETLIKEKIYILFPELIATERLVVYQKILECLLKRQHFVVFDEKSDEEFDKVVFSALLSSERESPIAQLILTIIWNRQDLAKEKVLTISHDWKPHLFELAMIISLAMDRVEFVKLFLEFGVNMESLLTNDLLEFLYAFAARSPTSLLKYDFEIKDFTTVSVRPEYDQIIETICSIEGINICNSAIPRRKIESIIKIVCKVLSNDDDQEIIENISMSFHEKKHIHFLFPYRELFFWAVLNNRYNMAVYLWQFEEEAISKALIAAEINEVLYTRARKLELQDEIVKQHLNNSKAFKELAFQLLDECSRTNECKTIQLITSEFEQFSNQTCLFVAIDTYDLDFVAHTSVQLLLNELWSGYLKKRNVSSLQMVCGYFFPLYINQLEFYSEEAFNAKYFVSTDEDTNMDRMCVLEDDLNIELSSSTTTTTTTTTKSKTKKISFFKKLYMFYFHTPAIKFYANFCIYIFFLLIYAYMCLKKEHKELKNSDYFTIVYVCAHLGSEIYQLVRSRGKTAMVKLRLWSESHWNKLDLTATVVFFIALGLRLDNRTAHVAHVLYAIDAGFWVVKLLHEFLVHRVLGPYVVMIIQMTKDLMHFLVIILVFLISYGITMKALLRPTVNDFINVDELATEILLIPYLNIFGEFSFSIPAQDNSTTKFGTPVTHPAEEIIAWIYTCIYLLVMNILLTNIIIAVFNNTFNYIQENSERIWKFQRQELVVEYAERVPVPIPLSLIMHFVLLMRWFLNKCGVLKELPEPKHILKATVSNERRDELLEFENTCMMKLMREREY